MFDRFLFILTYLHFLQHLFFEHLLTYVINLIILKLFHLILGDQLEKLFSVNTKINVRLLS